MSGLEDAVNQAYERAQTSTDPTDWRVYHALQATLDAERAKGHEPASTEGIADPPVKNIRIPRPPDLGREKGGIG
jgi:hypothetical protein